MKSHSQNQQPNLIVEQRTLLRKIYSQGDNLWKVLIFDNFNRQINSSLFKMKDLRENNITLYFHIQDHREQLHGVTAIYLVQPNKENLDRIVQDFDEDLYSSIVVHFSSEPQAHIVSGFAKQLAKNKPAALTKISKV
jgi:sec1 family domain-containing protein 1